MITKKRMEKHILVTNEVFIIGKTASEFQYSHRVKDECFYTVNVIVERKSRRIDYIPIMASEAVLGLSENMEGNYVYIDGQFRSYNQHIFGKSRMVLSVFAKKIEFLAKEESGCYYNQIYLDGYLCKEPIYRKTPMGREVTDILVAVNRTYNKADYIPCICWGKNARFAARLSIGFHIRLLGRIQSREYLKKTDEAGDEIRIAYELSVITMKHLSGSTAFE